MLTGAPWHATALETGLRDGKFAYTYIVYAYIYMSDAQRLRYLPQEKYCPTAIVVANARGVGEIKVF